MRNAPNGGSIARVAVAAGAIFASYYCLFSAAPKAFEHTDESAGVLIAVLMVVVIAVQPIIAMTTRTYRLPATGASLSMAAGLALSTVTAWGGIALIGVGFGAFVTLSAGWVKQLSSASGVGGALGLYGACSAVGGAIGSPLGLFLVDAVGPAGALLGGAGLAVIGAALCALSSDPIRQRHTDDLTVDAVYSQRNVGEALLFIAVLLFTVVSYAALLSRLGHPESQWSAASAVGIAVGIQFAVALGRLSSGWVMRRFGATGTAVGASIAALPLLALILFGAGTWQAALTCLVCGAFGLAQTATLEGLMQRARDARSANRASAIWNMTFDLGLGAGAFIAN